MRDVLDRVFAAVLVERRAPGRQGLHKEVTERIVEFLDMRQHSHRAAATCSASMQYRRRLELYDAVSRSPSGATTVNGARWGK